VKLETCLAVLASCQLNSQGHYYATYEGNSSPLAAEFLSNQFKLKFRAIKGRSKRRYEFVKSEVSNRWYRRLAATTRKMQTERRSRENQISLWSRAV
jgi:hypothetical protein